MPVWYYHRVHWTRMDWRKNDIRHDYALVSWHRLEQYSRSCRVLVIAFILIALMHIVFGALAPKTVAVRKAEQIARYQQAHCGCFTR